MLSLSLLSSSSLNSTVFSLLRPRTLPPSLLAFAASSLPKPTSSSLPRASPHPTSSSFQPFSPIKSLPTSNPRISSEQIFESRKKLLNNIYQVREAVLEELKKLKQTPNAKKAERKPFPHVEFPDLGCYNLLHSFLNNKLNSVVELNVDKGDIFLEGLLVNGWLSKLVFLCGHVEKSVAIWAFNTMLYSSKEELFNSSTDFWCAILSSEEEVNQMPLKIDWFPEYADLRRALDIYGFLFKFSSSSEPNNLDSDIERRPPQNTRAWIRFVTVCSLIRSKKEIFSTAEAEEIVEIIICLFLDRQFLGLLVLLKDCMEAIVNYFTDQEWCSSCENIAKFIACRVSKDLNCIQTIECISEATSRCKQLRSAVAHQTLLSCFHGVNSGEEVLRSLTEINFKDKSCDFYKMFINLVLTENWVLCNSSIEDNPVIYEMFCLYLQNCSTLISATNLRSYASKVRHRASYLLHFSIYK